MKTEDIAKVCHEANRAYCEVLDGADHALWEDAPEWQRKSATDGVAFAIANPNAGPEAQHDSWSAAKVADGWKVGPVKDAAKKEHPCLVPYDQLPVEQRLKDALFQAVVRVLA